jgi:hypothetical protein
MSDVSGSGAGVVIARALAVSVVMSLFMMLATLGFIYLFSDNAKLPLPLAVLFIVFAVSFIAVAVLIDRASEDLLASFMGGAAVALSVTIFITALVSGATGIADKMTLPDLDLLLAGFAVCLIASLIINRLTLNIS